MKPILAVKEILAADKFVMIQEAEEEHRKLRGIALIAAIAFGVMSILNVEQHSMMMLASTMVSSLVLLLGYMLSRYKHCHYFLKLVFYLIFVFMFTAYTIMGGNDGFAVLWLMVATYAVMGAIDFKAGFIISLYSLIMLFMVFGGPLTSLLQYAYNETFMLRFPYLYAINFAFATYIVIRIRLYQYELLLKQEELKRLSTFDLSTGLRNRNYFIQSADTFSYEGVHSLIAVYFDVNGLHEVNNREGHHAGDKMLYDIADLCKAYFSDDGVYRMGGDEFLVVCKNRNKSHINEQVSKLVDEVKVKGYSVSYGMATQESDFDINRVVREADEKMIAFKKAYYQEENRKHR